MNILITIIGFTPLTLSIIALVWSIKYTHETISLRRKIDKK